eukprot:6455533-Prymnesium_polylepis.1
MIPFKYATYSRLGHALLPTHYDVSAFVWWLHALFTPLKWLVWRLVELLIQLQFRIPTEMVPTERIEIDVTASSDRSHTLHAALHTPKPARRFFPIVGRCSAGGRS